MRKELKGFFQRFQHKTNAGCNFNNQLLLADPRSYFKGGVRKISKNQETENF